MADREYVILEDKNGKEVLPVTDGNGVFVEGGTKKLDKKLTEINEQLDNITKKLVVSVTDFGAKGDGVTDDTEAIKKTLDKAASIMQSATYPGSTPLAVTIKFPKGVYKTSPIKVTTPVILEGESQQNTTLLINVSANSVGVWFNCHGCHLKKIRVLSNGEVGDTNKTVGIRFYREDGGVVNSSVSNYIIDGFSGVGIDFVQPINCWANDGIIFRNGIGIQGRRHPITNTVGTTLRIEGLYIQSAVTHGIKLIYCQQNKLNNILFEYCDIGLYMERSFSILDNLYFEQIRKNDIQTIDSQFISLGFSRKEKDDDRQWTYNYPNVMLDTMLKQFSVETRDFVQVGDNNKSKKAIGIYNIINIEGSDKLHSFDGITYDVYRNIPFITANNLLLNDKWTGDGITAYDSTIMAMRWTHNANGYTQQKLTLNVGDYELIYMTKTWNGNGQFTKVELIKAQDSAVVKTFTIDSNSKYNYAQERYNILNFNIESNGEYIIRFSGTQIGGKINLGFMPILYQRKGDIFTEGELRFDYSFDQSMRNSMKIAYALSQVENGFSLISGKKEILDTKAPTNGVFSVGDKVHNTSPTPGGYLGWICVEAGSPGKWKGFGLIES